MPTLKKKFENGSELVLNWSEPASSFSPYSQSDVIVKPGVRRKRPHGPTMTPYSVRDNLSQYFDAHLENIVFTQNYTSKNGWYYTEVCPGASNGTTVDPLASSSNTTRRDGLLGAGGIGTQFLHHEALRLVGKKRTPVNITNVSSFGLQHYGLKSQDGKSYHDLGDIISDLQRKVSEETLESYDALTEFAERTKTLQTVFSLLRGCVRPLSTLRSLGTRLKTGPGTTLADLGLQYEYAIRPLLYSMDSISKIINNHGKFVIRKTRSKSITFSTDSQVPTTGLRSYDRGSVQVRIKAGSYFHYEDEIDRVTGSVGINPLLTAWELIPYSFVLDWFVGIGDWLVFQTSSLSQIGARALFYVSVRELGSYESVLENDPFVIPEYKTTASYSDSWSNNTCFSGNSTPVQGAGIVVLNSERVIPAESFPGSEAVYFRRRLNSYDRSLFKPSDLPIEVNNPFDLSKRRLLDAVMLLSAQLRK